MTIFFVFIFGLYYLLTVFLIIGFKKAMAKNVGDAEAIPTKKISVIVAFKNEEHNLVALIQSIDAQNYPKECFEVILVDDDSNDRSVPVVREAIKGLSNFELITQI